MKRMPIRPTNASVVPTEFGADSGITPPLTRGAGGVTHRTLKQPMSIRRTYWRPILVSCTLTVLFSTTLLPWTAPSAQAQSVIQRIQSIVTGKRKQGSASGRSRAGATRSQCPQIDESNTLMALVPEHNEGLTTQGYPAFWFYVPFGSSSATFRLLDEDKKPVLKQPLHLRLPEEKGLVRVTLPSTEKPLEVGKRYQWFFNITCTNHQNSQTRIAVKGWIKRVQPSPNLVQQLQTTRPQDQYVLYVNNDIWYETIAQLAEHREVHPQEWTQLLTLFELNDFAEAPITELQRQSSNLGQQ